MSSTRSRLSLMVLASASVLLCGASGLIGQEGSQQQPFKTGTRTVGVYATVSEETGRLVAEPLRAERPATPFIVVTGALTGSLTGAAIRAGAEDVVLKADLGSLVPSISTALSPTGIVFSTTAPPGPNLMRWIRSALSAPT